MAHDTQLPVCGLTFKIMNEKLDKIIESNEAISINVIKLNENRIEQSAINKEVYKSFESLNSKVKEQEEVIDALSLFVWIGKNWASLTAAIVGIGGLIVAYLALK